MDPVPVLLNDVAVELVDSELGAFPPGIDSSSPPGPNSHHSQVAEVLEELGFIHLPDSEPSDRNQVPAHAVGVEEEHGAQCPYGK